MTHPLYIKRGFTRKHLIVIFFISFIIGIILLFVFNNRNIETGLDAHVYDRIATNLTKENIFSLSEYPPYKPTMYSDPGYPYFVSIFYKIFGRNLIPIAIFQILLWSFAVIVFYFLIKRISSEKVASISTIILILFPVITSYTCFLATEGIFCSLIIFMLFGLLKLMETNKIKWAIITGVLFGLSYLVKSVIAPYSIIILVLPPSV